MLKPLLHDVCDNVLTPPPPPVLWAQRSSTTDADKNYVYLTIGMPDVPKDSLKLDIKATSIEASGHSTTKNLDYATKLELFGEVCSNTRDWYVV
jgi:hypothetical protein